MEPIRDNRVAVGRGGAIHETQVAAGSSFLLQVYNWMTLGLGLTAVVSALMVANPELVLGLARQRGVLFALILVELGLVGALAGWVGRMSVMTATAVFLFYAALNGVTLSVVFLAYTSESIASTFFVTSATFGTMSLYGYITKRDLTGLGTFCLMGLFGLIIASVVNIFMQSPMLYWWTTFAGVIVFVGLTAYDTQKLKMMSIEGDGRRQAISGALMLYLDFINLFLIMLRLFGRRRD